MDKEYNGFNNFPTWFVWSVITDSVDNMLPLYLEFADRWEGENKAYRLGQRLKNDFEDMMLHSETICHEGEIINDTLMPWVLSFVNWEHLAQKLIDMV